MSEQLISHKVKSFHSKDVIRGYYPLIDYSRFGLLNFIVFFKAQYKNEETFKKLIEVLKEDDSILSVIECDGRYDLAVVFAALNPSSFNKKHKKLVSDYPELWTRMILTTVVEHYYLRNYLVDKQGTDDVIIGGDREEITFDGLNRSIIGALVSGHKRVTDIAKEVDSTPKTVMIRLKALEQQQVIKGYRLLLSSGAIGVSMNMILIRFKNITIEQDDKFRTFASFSPHITSLAKTFGEWDVVMYVESRNRSEFRALSLQLRQTFDEIIEDMDNLRIFSVHSKQCLPKESFS